MPGLGVGSVRGIVEQRGERLCIHRDARRGAQLGEIEQCREHRRAQRRLRRTERRGIAAFARGHRQLELQIAVHAAGIDDRHAEFAERNDGAVTAPAPSGGSGRRGNGKQCRSGSQAGNGSAHEHSMKAAGGDRIAPHFSIIDAKPRVGTGMSHDQKPARIRIVGSGLGKGPLGGSFATGPARKAPRPKPPAAPGLGRGMIAFLFLGAALIGGIAQAILVLRA